ncbi:hypothetical protein T492DRAFT_842557 [Pavlovales sp. CCMP2436]|nr:hypothetical protein T492DRAFT_842557 [Pavlovales sp. CCMP2436]
MHLFLLANPLLLSIPVLICGGWQALSDHGNFDLPITWLLGMAAAPPISILGKVIEGSRNEQMTDINLQTDLLALKLFGSRSQPIFAGLACAALAIAVGVVEEMAFRGLMLPASASLLETFGLSPQGATNTTIVLSTAVFAVGHLNPSDYRRPSPEVGVTLGLQTLSGFWFALVAIGMAPFAVESAERDMKSSSTLHRWASERGLRWASDVAYLFHFLDRDRSGTIEAHKLRLGLLAYGIKSPRRKLASLWKAVGGGSGRDGLETGSLTYDQFATIIAKRYRSRSKISTQAAPPPWKTGPWSPPDACGETERPRRALGRALAPRGVDGEHCRGGEEVAVEEERGERRVGAQRGGERLCAAVGEPAREGRGGRGGVSVFRADSAA